MLIITTTWIAVAKPAAAPLQRWQSSSVRFLLWHLHTGNFDGDGAHSGLVGVVETGAGRTMNKCGFYGRMEGSSTNANGGLIGWTKGPITIEEEQVQLRGYDQHFRKGSGYQLHH